MRVDRISRLFTGVHHRGRDVLCHYIHEARCRPEKLGEDQLQQRLRIQIKLRYIRGQQKKGTREETERALLLPRPPRGPIKIMIAGNLLVQGTCFGSDANSNSVHHRPFIDTPAMVLWCISARNDQHDRRERDVEIQHKAQNYSSANAIGRFTCSLLMRTPSSARVCLKVSASSPNTWRTISSLG